MARAALRWRTGSEGRISALKRCHGLCRCRYRGESGMQRWIGLGVIAFISLVAFWVMIGKYVSLRGELEDTRTLMTQGSLVQPPTMRDIFVTPDRVPGIDKARITLSRSAPLLMEVHIDLSYTKPLMEFRLFVDKKDQGRALVLNDLLKDSNGELRMTVNSTGLSAGIYNVRIEALPPRGIPIPVGWLLLDVR
jgi:hypothetical protein